MNYLRSVYLPYIYIYLPELKLLALCGGDQYARSVDALGDALLEGEQRHW